MSNGRNGKINGTIIIRVMCAVCFCVFSFLWLYELKADALAVAQHALSNGQTHYDRTVGAIIITVVLQLLQALVYGIVKLSHRTHALTYLPSMLLLALVSDINPDADRFFFMGAWSVVVPVVVVVWTVVVWFSRQMLPFDAKKRLFSLQWLWMNMLQMVIMMLAVGLMANTDAVFHYRAHAEMAIKNNDFAEALRVGDRSAETDCNLTMLRFYALAHEHQLGERLFHYPVAGNADDMLPMHGSRSRLLILSPDTLWKRLGGRPVYPRMMTAKRFLRVLERDSMASDIVPDYILCLSLIDRRLDDFAAYLPLAYALNDSLPVHYREALALLGHVSPDSQPAFSDSLMQEQLADFLDMRSRIVGVNERRMRLFEKYKSTYWYYYFCRDDI